MMMTKALFLSGHGVSDAYSPSVAYIVMPIYRGEAFDDYGCRWRRLVSLTEVGHFVYYRERPVDITATIDGMMERIKAIGHTKPSLEPTQNICVVAAPVLTHTLIDGAKRYGAVGFGLIYIPETQTAEYAILFLERTGDGEIFALDHSLPYHFVDRVRLVREGTLTAEQVVRYASDFAGTPLSVKRLILGLGGKGWLLWAQR